MVLCFGTFAGVLNLCRQNITQEKFVPRIAWVVDRRNSSLGSELDFDVEDPRDITPNKDVVSRLLSCQRPLVLRDGQLPTQELAKERFASQVMPSIKEEMIAKALLAVLYIIDSDLTIENEHKGTFKKVLGMDKDELLNQARFNVPDFFSRVLLYTTHIKNRADPKDQPYKKMTHDFIEKVVKDSWVELKWDADTQTVEIIPFAEKRLRDEINRLSELRLSLLPESVGYTDTDWLGVDKSILFPSNYSHIKFEDPEVKALVSKKMVRYTKLVREFTDCLAATQQSAGDKMDKWPIFPDEKLREIWKQLTDLSEELFVLSLFPESLPPEQEPEEITIDSE